MEVLPAALSKFKKIHSSYKINLNTLDCCSNVDLNTNAFDINISYAKLEHNEKIINTQIGTEEVILISDIDFPINSIKKQQLFDLPLIFPSDKKWLNHLLSSALDCNQNNLNKLNILYTTNSYFLALNGVLSSKSLTFIPISMFNTYSLKMNIKKLK